jgi:hypothetical protein
MNITKEERGQLLFAQFAILLSLKDRVHELQNGFPEFARLNSVLLRDKANNPVLFAGTFSLPSIDSIAPFSLGFHDAANGRSGLNQLAETTNGYRNERRKSTLLYLSIIDYLVESGELNRTFDRYVGGFSGYGRDRQRDNISADYPD